MPHMNKPIDDLHESIRIVAFSPAYKSAFKNLNEEWISAYFKMEAADYRALDEPEAYIINKGGFILVALDKDIPVGVCALVKMNDSEYDFELAKMAVSPAAQGKRIGLTLALAILEKARSEGARMIFIESNTILEPAINLYRKLGFIEVTSRATPYERCNIQMELDLLKKDQ